MYAMARNTAATPHAALASVTKSARRNPRSMEKCFSMLGALDQDQLAARGPLAQLDKRRVFLRPIPVLRLLRRWELERHDALGRPAAFERLHLAAAHHEFSAVPGHRREHLLAVLLVGGRIGDFDLAYNVCRHAALPVLGLHPEPGVYVTRA